MGITKIDLSGLDNGFCYRRKSDRRNHRKKYQVNYLGSGHLFRPGEH